MLPRYIKGCLGYALHSAAMRNQCSENQRFWHFTPYSQQFLLKRNKTYFFSILRLTSTEYKKEDVKVYNINDYTLFHLPTQKVRTNYGKYETPDARYVRLLEVFRQKISSVHYSLIAYRTVSSEQTWPHGTKA